MASPGLRKSMLCRIPGRLRMAARSDLSKDMRLKIPAMVSLRPPMTPIVEARLACCMTAGALIEGGLGDDARPGDAAPPAAAALGDIRGAGEPTGDSGRSR